MSQQSSHLAARAVQAALDRSDWDVQRGRGLGVVEILQIMENENGPVLFAHRLKGSLHLDGARRARGRIFRPDVLARPLAGFFERLRDVALAFAQDVERRVHGDAVDPGRQLRVASERPERAQRADENVLHRVARVLNVSGHPQRDRVDTLLVLFNDRVERPGLAAREPLDELAILPLGHRALSVADHDAFDRWIDEQPAPRDARDRAFSDLGYRAHIDGDELHADAPDDRGAHLAEEHRPRRLFHAGGARDDPSDHARGFSRRF